MSPVWTRATLLLGSLVTATITLVTVHIPLVRGGPETGSSSVEVTTILYDGRLITTPDRQGFDWVTLGPASQTISGPTTLLDTLASPSSKAGYFANLAADNATVVDLGDLIGAL